MAEDDAEQTATRTRSRSPNAPVIDLEAAVGYAAKLHAKSPRHAVPVEAVLHNEDYWGLSKGGYSGQVLGAVRAFGLVETEGRAAKRLVRVTEEGAKIIRNHPDRAKLLHQVALLPRVNRAVWEHYQEQGGLPPSDEAISHYLEFDHDPPFTPKSIPGFIKQIRGTVAFAGLEESATLPESENDQDSTEEEAPIKVGDFVQWTSQGVAQFPEGSREVLGLSDDGDWAYVTGTKTGLPVSELAIKERDGGTQNPKTLEPPPNPFAGSGTGPRLAEGVSEETSQIPGVGVARIQWPSMKEAGEAGFEDFDYWLQGVRRKVAREAGVDLKNKKD